MSSDPGEVAQFELIVGKLVVSALLLAEFANFDFLFSEPFAELTDLLLEELKARRRSPYSSESCESTGKSDIEILLSLSEASSF